MRESTLESDVNLLKREEAATENELEQILGRKENSPIQVAGHLNREKTSIDLSQITQIAIAQNPEIRQVNHNLSVAEVMKSSIQGDYYPKIDVEAKFGRLANEEKVFANSGNSQVRLNLSIPIFSGLETKYAKESKIAEIQKNLLTKAHIEQEVRMQIENFITQIRSIEERLDLEEKNIVRSENYYKITLAEYKKGVKNSPDVAGAAERLFDAKLRNLEFRKELLFTKIALAQAAGIDL